MRLLWLLFLYSNSLLFACCESTTGWLDDWEKKFEINKFIDKENWYPFMPQGHEPLDSSVFMTPFLAQLQKNGFQFEKDQELHVCMTASHIQWSIKRLLIAGCVFAGANPNVKYPHGNPLINACRKQDFELVRFLCQNGADVHCADECHDMKMILFDVRKYKIAHYLVEHGAAMKEAHDKSTLLHEQIVLNVKGSWRLVPLYLDKKVSISNDCENIFHRLAYYSYTYGNNTPKMLKKFNAIVTYLMPEETLRLLQERDKSYRLLPEERCTIKSPAATVPYVLARVMKEKRELLEQALANSKKES